MWGKKSNELPIPPEAAASNNSAEMVRFWVADGYDHVSLKLDMIQSTRDHHEAEIWGSILADIAHHVVRGLPQTGCDDSPEVLFSLIQRGFAERLKEKANITGGLLGSPDAH